MSEAQNKVSIWFGKFKTESEFDDFIKKNYDEDGNSIPSSFMKVFEIDRYDEDFQEAFYDNAMDESSFEELSYAETFSDKIKIDFSACNCVILLYDFNYKGPIKKTANLFFYGALDYSK